jgi:transcriptional regulator with XRE-family HTH domain
MRGRSRTGVETLTRQHADTASPNSPAGWVAELRAARLSTGLSQQDAALVLGVRKATLIGWEIGRRLPMVENLLAAGREYGMRLVVFPWDGRVNEPRLEVAPGEPWARAELRRLAAALRRERVALKLSRKSVAASIGVSAWSLAHFERAQLNPRLPVLAAWAQTVKCDIRWQDVV